MKDKLLFAMFFVIILPITIAQNEQSHPLSEIKPIDTNLDMFGFNITNVTFLGINLTNPQYALHVAGDVFWTGILRGGIVPWNLLTNYPSIITPIGSGLIVDTQSLANNVTLGVNFTEVQRRITGSCSGSNAIQFIYENGSVSCIDINLYGNVTGTGISGYIPLWQTSSNLNNSLINQTNGNIWITSGNLNILLGGLEVGGTNVIDSSRNILNVNWVNASYLNISAGFVVLPSGNVGIGTISPGAKLDVAGDIALNDNPLKLRNYSDSFHQIDYSTSIFGLSDVDYWNYNSYLVFSQGTSNPRVTITGAGNVGIGTTNPGEKLEVYGNIKLSGYINIADSYIRKAGSSIVISDV